MQWSIVQVARKLNISTYSLRYYDKIGLLSPKRLPNGYRYYEEHDIMLLQYIIVMRHAQFTLAEIKHVFSFFTKEEEDTYNKVNREMLASKLVELHLKIKDLKSIIKIIETALSLIATKKIEKKNIKEMDAFIQQLFPTLKK